MTRFDAGRPRCPERGPRTTWEALEEILPGGSGRCLDVGCGQGRHRRIIEGAGYQWVGLDRAPSEGVIVGDAHRLPFADGTFSLAVMWLSLQYFERPWQALSEVRRVLRPGGGVVGSAAFLEPFHNSCFGFTEWGLRALLADAGFTDVEIRPGLNCASLIAWTLASRMAGGSLAAAALRWTSAAVRAANALYPSARGMLLRLSGAEAESVDESYWLSKAPYHFAGHLMFSARLSPASTAGGARLAPLEP